MCVLWVFVGSRGKRGKHHREMRVTEFASFYKFCCSRAGGLMAACHFDGLLTKHRVKLVYGLLVS